MGTPFLNLCGFSMLDSWDMLTNTGQNSTGSHQGPFDVAGVRPNNLSKFRQSVVSAVAVALLVIFSFWMSLTFHASQYTVGFLCAISFWLSSQALWKVFKRAFKTIVEAQVAWQIWSSFAFYINFWILYLLFILSTIFAWATLIRLWEAVAPQKFAARHRKEQAVTAVRSWSWNQRFILNYLFNLYFV